MFFIFFERPSFRLNTYKYISAEKYLLGFELSFIVFYFFVSLLKILIVGKKYFKSASNLMTISIVVIMFTDVIIALSGVVIFRFSRLTRPILLILKVKTLRHAARGLIYFILILFYFIFIFYLFL